MPARRTTPTRYFMIRIGARGRRDRSSGGGIPRRRRGRHHFDVDSTSGFREPSAWNRYRRTDRESKAMTDLRIITGDGGDAILEEAAVHDFAANLRGPLLRPGDGDRKSTRLNSSHVRISYAVFC